MLANLTPFLLHWAITAVSLWVASHLFKGIRFSSTGALVVSALLLVAKLVNGFKVDGFWTALWASLFIALLSLVLGAFVLGGTPDFQIQTSPAPGSAWL